MEIIINGGNARYLSELPEFQDGLPHGIVNKTKDAKLRLLFPHISDSVFCNYLTGISTGFSGSPISVAPTIF